MVVYPDQQKHYHRITDEYRAFGDARTEFCQASQVETGQVGPYEVVMNRSNHTDVRVEGEPGPHQSAIDGDTVSGQAVDPSADVLVEANQSLVLDRRRRVDGPATGEEPELTASSMDERTPRIHWEWSVLEDCTEGGPTNSPGP